MVEVWRCGYTLCKTGSQVERNIEGLFFSAGSHALFLVLRYCFGDFLASFQDTLYCEMSYKTSLVTKQVYFSTMAMEKYRIVIRAKVGHLLVLGS